MSRDQKSLEMTLDFQKLLFPLEKALSSSVHHGEKSQRVV